MDNNPHKTIILLVNKFRDTGYTNSLCRTSALLQVLENLNEQNRVMVLRCFLEAAKVICSRQNSLRKPQLKMREIRSALELITFHYDRTSNADTSCAPLNDLLGVDLTVDRAIEYFEKHVEGELCDIYNRKIIITADALCHLYKDRDGRHTMENQYFQSTRGKRLPWIRHTLCTTREIYKKRDRNWIIYAYVKGFTVPTNSGVVNNFLFVVARTENPQAPIKFVTAYYLDDHEVLLKKIEEFEPYHGPISPGPPPPNL